MTNDELFALRDSWYVQARKQRLDTLPDFFKLLSDYNHDYNTICYACGAAAVAAATAIDHSPKGGITEFQAGAIMWEFISEWMGKRDKPMKLIDYENMLYPQYASSFSKTISQETMDWLKDQAAKKLAEDDGLANPAVLLHWRRIVSGKIPFGYEIRN